MSALLTRRWLCFAAIAVCVPLSGSAALLRTAGGDLGEARYADQAQYANDAQNSVSAGDAAAVIADNDLADAGAAAEPLLGLTLGTQQGFADVVRDGVPLPPFSRAGAPFPFGQDSVRLFLGGVSTSSVRGVTAMAQNEAVAIASAVLSPEGPGSAIDISCACRGKGTASVMLELQLSEPTMLPPRIFLQKNCAARALPGLAVGTALGKSDAAVDGRPAWTPRAAPVVPYEAQETILYVSMTQQSHPKQLFEEPEVHVRAVEQASLAGDIPPAADSHQVVGRHASAAFFEAPPASGKSSTLDVHVKSALSMSGGLAFGQPVELKIEYQCLKPGTVLLELVLRPRPAWDPFAPMSLFIKKVCGGLDSPSLQVGTSPLGSDLVRNGKQHSPAPDITSIVGVSHFYVQYSSLDTLGKTDPDQKVQPTLHCESAVGRGHQVPLDAALTVGQHQGHGTGGGRYNVVYGCKHRGTAVCKLRLGLKLWDSPEIVWHKHCGGARQDIAIDSNFEVFASVIRTGQPTVDWSIKSPKVWLPTEADLAEFKVRLDQPVLGPGVTGATTSMLAAEPVMLLAPEISVSNPAIMNATVEGASAWNSQALATPKDITSIRVHHTCQGVGVVQVTVLLRMSEPSLPGSLLAHRHHSHTPLRQPPDPGLFDPVTFSYLKRCDAEPLGPLNVASGVALSLFTYLEPGGAEALRFLKVESRSGMGLHFGLWFPAALIAAGFALFPGLGRELSSRLKGDKALISSSELLECIKAQPPLSPEEEAAREEQWRNDCAWRYAIGEDAHRNEGRNTRRVPSGYDEESALDFNLGRHPSARASASSFSAEESPRT